MEIKTVKAEVPFKEIAPLELFMYNKKVYMKIPELAGDFDCYTGGVVSSKSRRTYNAININLGNHFYTTSDYSQFVPSVMVLPLKTELTIYEVTID